MTAVRVDTGDMRRFAAEVSRAGLRAVPPARAALEASTRTLNAQMRQDARAAQRRQPSRIRRLPDVITSTVHGLSSETGPERRGQGLLAGILYGGTARTGPVVADPAVALAKVTPAFLAAVEAAGARSVLR